MGTSERDRHLADLPDPERWSDRPYGASIEGTMGGDLARIRVATMPNEAALLLRAPSAVAVDVPSQRASSWRVALVAAAIVLATSGAVLAARQVLAPPRRAEQAILVPPTARVVVAGPRRRRLTITGPARLELEPALPRGGGDVEVSGGLLIAEAGEVPLLVTAGGLSVLVPREGSGEIDGSAGREPLVRALAGELRVRSGAGPTITVSPIARAETPSPAPLPSGAPPATSPGPPPTPSAPAEIPARQSSPVTPHRRSLGARARLPASPSSPAAWSLTDPPPYEARYPSLESNGEGQVLMRAFRALRSQRNPAAALATLDDYQRRFPAGTLGAEARLARVEALLALGRASEALPLLMGAGPEADDLAATREVRLVRAELLSQTGRCSDAMPDFDALLASEVLGDVAAERARYGRAACRLRAGDREGARRDLEQYLVDHPRGGLRPAVVRSLKDLHQR